MLGGEGGEGGEGGTDVFNIHPALITVFQPEQPKNGSKVERVPIN